MPRTLEDLTGRAFGDWTVVGRAPNSATVNETIWSCRCSCGSTADVPKSNLTRGRSTRCVECRIAASVKPKKPKIVGKRVKIVGADHHRPPVA